MPPNNHPDRNTIRPRDRVTPRAKVHRVLDTILADRILSLVDEYYPLPISETISLYKSRYGIHIDVYALGLERGILGLYESLLDSVELYKHREDGRWFVQPNSRRRDQISLTETAFLSPPFNNNHIKFNSIQEFKEKKEKARMELRQAIFNQDNNYLWTPEFKPLLVTEKRYKIAVSPFEMATSRYRQVFETEIAGITATLRKYPNGILLNHLYNLCPIRKNILNVSSIEEATNQYPEVFYRVEPEVDGKEPLLYDGTTKTYNDLTGNKLNLGNFDRHLMVYRAIVSGIFQKTLIILRQVGTEGLKLSTWYQTITDTYNFQLPKRLREHDQVLKETPLTFLLVLRSFEMIDIQSHKDKKNDLRIHLPNKQINWENFWNHLVSNTSILLRQSLDNQV